MSSTNEPLGGSDVTDPEIGRQVVIARQFVAGLNEFRHTIARATQPSDRRLLMQTGPMAEATDLQRKVHAVIVKSLFDRHPRCEHLTDGDAGWWCLCCGTGPRCEQSHGTHLEHNTGPMCGQQIAPLRSGIDRPDTEPVELIGGTVLAGRMIHGEVCVSCGMDHEAATLRDAQRPQEGGARRRRLECRNRGGRVI